MKGKEVAASHSMSRPEPFMIASVAKTLTEVKALPAAEQDMLSLRRLVHRFSSPRYNFGTTEREEEWFLIPKRHQIKHLEFVIS
jgi:hypothetical protein